MIVPISDITNIILHNNISTDLYNIGILAQVIVTYWIHDWLVIGSPLRIII